jgi:cytochrome c1
MKLRSLIALLVVVFITSCGGEEKKKSTTKSPVKKAAVKKTPTKKVATKKVTSGDIIDLNNKGIGPIKSVTLGALDQSMADNGKKIFKNKCSSCHKTTKKFIGPNPTGILKRRSPEWVMNMIMNPAEMVKEDPIARQLFIKFNGSPMANQNLTKDETRAVLEYFRTLK